jgi:hypothetical protein
MGLRRVSDPAPMVITDRSSETFSEPSRHDDQMLVARIVPADPYATWLDKRERDRRLASMQVAGEAQF